MVPIPLVLSGVQLLVQAAQAESAARRADAEQENEALRIRALATDLRESRQHEFAITELHVSSQVQLRQMQLAAADRASERPFQVLARFLDIESHFADRKLDFLKDSFAATRDLLADAHRQLLTEHGKYSDALLIASGPKESVIKARLRELDEELKDIQRGQAALSAGFTEILTLLQPGIAGSATMLAALPHRRG